MKARLEQTTLVQCLFYAQEFRSSQPLVLRSIITYADIFLLIAPKPAPHTAAAAAAEHNAERLALLDHVIGQTKRELFAAAQIRGTYTTDSRDPATTSYVFNITELSSNATIIAIRLIQQHYQGMEAAQQKVFKQNFILSLGDQQRNQKLRHEQSIYEAMLTADFSLPELMADNESGAAAAAAPADGDLASAITESKTYKEVLQLNRALALLNETQNTLTEHLDTRPKVNLGRISFFGLGGSEKQRQLDTLHNLLRRCKHTLNLAFNHAGISESAQSILRSRSMKPPQTKKQIKAQLANPGTHQASDTGNSLYLKSQTLCQAINQRLARSRSHSSASADTEAQATKPQKPRARTMTEHYISFSELAAKQQQAASGGGGSRDTSVESDERQALTLGMVEPYQMAILVQHLSDTLSTLDQSVDLIRYLLRRSSCDYLIQMMRAPTTEDSTSTNYDPYALLLWSLTAHMKKAFFDHSNFDTVLAAAPKTGVIIDHTKIPTRWQHFMHALVIVNNTENTIHETNTNPQTSFTECFANTCVKQIINSFDTNEDAMLAFKLKTDKVKGMFDSLLTSTKTAVGRAPYTSPASAAGVDRDFAAEQPLQDCLNSAAFQADLALHNLTFLTSKLKLHLNGRKPFNLGRALGSEKKL